MKLLTKLIIIITSSSIVAIAISGTFIYGSIRSNLQTQISSNQLEVTRQTLDKIDRFLYERQADIQDLAQQEEVVSFITSSRPSLTTKTLVQKHLDHFKTINNSWRDLVILDAKGATQIATNDSSQTQDSLNDDPSVTNLYAKALAGQTVFSDIFINQHSQKPTIIFLSPIKAGTTVTGVMEGEIDWPSVVQILQSIKGPTAYLLNHSGQVIGTNSTDTSVKILDTSYKSTDLFTHLTKGESQSSILPDPANSSAQAVLSYSGETGFMNYAGNGWYLALSTPTSTAFAGIVNQAVFLLFILLASTSIAGGVILLLLGRQVMNPIRDLSAGVDRIALGDLSQTVNVSSSDEIGTLSSSFNDMTRQLGATHRNLQEATRVAKEGRAQLESSINGLRQGFILTDVKGQIVMVNHAGRQMIVSSPDTPVANLASSSEPLKLDALTKLLPPELSLPDKIQLTLKDRNLSKFPSLPLNGRFLNLYLSPVMGENQAIGCVLLLEDVTEERILQRSRDEFFSIASHELRTPLTAIRGNISTLMEYFPEVLKDPNVKEMVSDVHESAIRLIEIVNDFLDASRLEQNKMKFNLNAFAIEPIIEKVIYELASISREKKVKLQFDHTTLGQIPWVYADENRIKQIVYNLVGNGLKFTEKGSVTVNAIVEGRMLKVCISDTGPGITPEGQQILFHKFQQSTDNILTRDNTRGTGLGLYISKLLLEHMNGQVRLEHTEVGKGTTFSFSIPVASPQQIADTKAHPNTAASADL